MIRWITTCLFLICAAGLMLHAQDPFRIAMIGCHRQLRSIPTIATWDDHDYDLNNAGKEYPLKEQSKAYFRQFWQLEEEIPEDRDGIYYSHYIEHQGKTVQFIMLDVRYNRDEPFSGGDVLGEKQWVWLEEELTKPADLRLVASGFQVLLGPDTGSETWSTFPEARGRLSPTIRRTGAQHLVFLTGDQHYGEVCRMRGALDFDAIELQFAGINQIEDPEYNPWRVAPAITSLHSYALIDLHLEETKTEVPLIAFSIFNAMTNERELRYRVNLSELETNLEWEGATRFTGTTKLRVKHGFPELRLGYTTDGPTRKPLMPNLPRIFPSQNRLRFAQRYSDRTVAVVVPSWNVRLPNWYPWKVCRPILPCDLA